MADYISILLADDHTLIQSAIRIFLNSQRNMEVVAVAADGAEAVRMTGTLQPDVVILDAVMPVLNGIQAAHEITQLPSPPKVVILSFYSMPELVLKAFDVGCAAYVVKSSKGDELIEAIHEALAGRAFLSARLRHLQADVEKHFRA